MEIWQPIQGYEELYQVSDQGRVRSIKFGRNKVLSQGMSKDGYCQVSLYKNDKVKCRRVHRLVASAFQPNPEGKPDVNHKDGDKTNNFNSNLEWSTKLENIVHAYKTGLKTGKSVRGLKNGNCKLSEEQVLEIKYQTEGEFHKDIATKYGVSKSLIGSIKSGLRWSHL